MVNKINFFYASHNNGIPSTIFTVDDYPKEPTMNTIFKVNSNLLLDSEPDNLFHLVKSSIGASLSLAAFKALSY